MLLQLRNDVGETLPDLGRVSLTIPRLSWQLLHEETNSNTVVDPLRRDAERERPQRWYCGGL
jgi:hypothetical protein